MWEYLDSFWPEVAALERRVNGVEPEKVEAEPFSLQPRTASWWTCAAATTPSSTTPSAVSRSEADEKAEATEAGRCSGAYGAATTRRGHTKARVDKVERPVRKDLLVPFQHVNQVIHDLAFHEYLIDANRLIRAPQIEAAIRDHYGVEVLRTIKHTLGAMAEGDQPAADALERAVNYMRTGSTIAGPGLQPRHRPSSSRWASPSRWRASGRSTWPRGGQGVRRRRHPEQHHEGDHREVRLHAPARPDLDARGQRGAEPGQGRA
jgi:hypothetical protein